eukprot:SM000018S03666  [mRNA]  locus=s18:663602:667641:- [translate_table: standard]
MLSHALLRVAERNDLGMGAFWLQQGVPALLALLASPQEPVQERAAMAIAAFVVIDDDNAPVDQARAKAVMHGGGVSMLLRLARASSEGVQAEAAKALANLSVNAEVANAVAGEGGVRVLAELAWSPNKWVAEEAAGGLWNLSVGEEHKTAIKAAGAIAALVDLAAKWPMGGEGCLERAAGALANLAADDKCSTEVARAGGVQALVGLARYCKHDGVQEQAARALANLAAHGDSNSNNAEVGREPGSLEALVQLTRSRTEGVRQEAAGALWNLSFDDQNREAIATVGGVEALVALAQACSIGGAPGLQERAAGALWGLSVSENNSISIGEEGGVSPLILLAQSLVKVRKARWVGWSSIVNVWVATSFGLPAFLKCNSGDGYLVYMIYWVSPQACESVWHVTACLKLMPLRLYNDGQDVHETAAGALWNLAFNPGNAVRIVEGKGVPVLVNLCASSRSKMARFMAALALAYMFDGSRSEEMTAVTGFGTQQASNMEAARKLALSQIEAFLQDFSDMQLLSAIAVSGSSAALAQVVEAARIVEAGHLRCRQVFVTTELACSLQVAFFSCGEDCCFDCQTRSCRSGAEIGRFVGMLRNNSPVLRSCAAFALVQFTVPGGRHAAHHGTLLQKAGAARALRAAAAATQAPIQARGFARLVLRNLELCDASV